MATCVHLSDDFNLVVLNILGVIFFLTLTLHWFCLIKKRIFGNILN